MFWNLEWTFWAGPTQFPTKISLRSNPIFYHHGQTCLKSIPFCCSAPSPWLTSVISCYHLLPAVAPLNLHQSILHSPSPTAPIPLASPATCEKKGNGCKGMQRDSEMAVSDLREGGSQRRRVAPSWAHLILESPPKPKRKVTSRALCLINSSIEGPPPSGPVGSSGQKPNNSQQKCLKNQISSTIMVKHV